MWSCLYPLPYNLAQFLNQWVITHAIVINKGLFFLELLPEVIDSSCEKCTTKQKQLMAKAVKFVKDNRPSDWEQLVNKYDPNHKRGDDVEKFLKEALA